MPGYAPVNPIAGVQPFGDTFAPDTVQRQQIGLMCDAVDPYFGGGRFMYLKYAASQAVATGRLVTIVDQTGLTVDAPSTAIQGYPFLVARQTCASSATAQYGWFQLEGICPLQVNASVAAGAAIGNAAAGVGGTNTAGKQLVGVKVLQASTFTLTKAGLPSPVGVALGKNIGVSNVDGLFIGLAVSGTGVPASSTITALDAGGRFFTMNNTLTAVPTGNTITFTYTNFVMAHINCPYLQGAIT